MIASQARVVILVVAYEAESTLEEVLSRIPRSLFNVYDCSLLVIDDASHDRTSDIARRYRQRHPELPLTLLRNVVNRGYGGSQKLGYARAIAAKADAVALLHGDAQYAPEELGRLLAPVCRGEADAVLGSRMLEPFAALRGGMPLYKFVGNKILTRVQNYLLGTRLSEFHSGYRVYSVPLLRRLQFGLNADGFHFDSEIIIQVLNAGGRILELPIPTHYGDELCRVNGIEYARDVLRVTLENVAHRTGMLHRRRFEPVCSDGEP